ncbi:MAG: hypothetical protein N3A38_09935, partial [Planctomycetota bacterium]|nr:hypothetical protein [Planctomycetota bacterium]
MLLKIRFRSASSVAFFAAVLAGGNQDAAAGTTSKESVPFPAEEIHDDFSGPDEAVTDLRIASNRWPDCFSNASAVTDIFRLEGVADRSDHEKAMALWKWFRILFCPKYGAYYWEEDETGTPRIVYDGHKIFTVYGRHYCDGTAWCMVDLWRAVGYIALD